MNRSVRSLSSLSVLPLLALALAAVPACSAPPDEAVGSSESELTTGQRMPRYARIRDSAANRGIRSSGYLFAGIAMDETGLAQCWSEATWACQGPSSPDCGGGPVIAGAADGACSAQQGGLGMFQFDSGTYGQTIGAYGNGVLTVEGQVSLAVDYVVRMVRNSVYTTDAETDDKARAWLERFDVGNGALRDQWIKTVIRYYNGCPEGGSCWGPRYQSYSAGLSQVLADTGGTGFWASGVSCPGGNGTAVGAIGAKYRALGGCGSVLGVPRSEEQRTPDGAGRYSVFDRGSIYWTEALGAFEVHGVIRDLWKELGWEPGVLGYPVSDEIATPDRQGRFSVFERGSVYWTEATGAHEVLGMIRDKWSTLEWEKGPLGYPISGEYDIPGGRRSDFQHGSISWNASTQAVTVVTN